jgi:hypothetical protein
MKGYDHLGLEYRIKSVDDLGLEYPVKVMIV